MANTILYQFITHNRDKLPIEGSIPWFMPEAWGGAGLPILVEGSDDDTLRPIYSSWAVPSKLDLQCAARIKERPKDFPVRKLPPGMTWTTWTEARKLLPSVCGDHIPDEHVQGIYDRVLAGLVVEVLLDPTLEIHDESPTKTSKLVLRRNERSWRRSRLSGNLPPPLSISTVTASAPQERLPLFEVVSSV